MKRLLNLPCYTVDYCMYGFNCMKHTNIWTNVEGFQPKLCNKQCGAFVNNKHILNAIGGIKIQNGDN